MKQNSDDSLRDAQVRRLLRALGRFDIGSEIETALAPRRGPDGAHPPRYDIETFACGDIADDTWRASVASHIVRCPRCRTEAGEFRALLRKAALHEIIEKPDETTIVRLPYRQRRSNRLLFTMPRAAAAAGGAVRQRSSSDATIRLLPLGELPGHVVVAIQLKDPANQPQVMRLNPPAEPMIDEPLPPADPQGLIQFVKDAAQLQDRRFLELLLDVPLEFLGFRRIEPRGGRQQSEPEENAP
jgi:hypothetical protein